MAKQSTIPITTSEELRALLNRRRYPGERITDKRAIRSAAEEIDRLRSALQEISDRAATLAG